MDSSQMIVWMIIGCIFFVVYVMFSRQFHAIFKMLLRGTVGCIGFILCNSLLSAYGLTVGINLLTAFVVGILGLPGFITLYAAQFLL